MLPGCLGPGGRGREDSDEGGGERALAVRTDDDHAGALLLGEGDEAIYSQYGFLVYPIAIQSNGATAVVADDDDTDLADESGRFQLLGENDLGENMTPGEDFPR